MRAAIAACLLNPQCPDCGRPRSPVDRCDPDSIDDDGECPYLTIERLRAELARRVSPAVAPVPGDMKTMDDCPFSAQIDQHRFATAIIDDHPKREFVPAGDYVPLETKYGPVMVLPTDGEHVNVEVREPNFVIDGVHFCFACCVQVRLGFRAALVGRLMEWSSGGNLTPRRKELLLNEIEARIDEAAAGPMAPALVEAQRRVLSNNILSCEKDVEEARKKLADLVAVLGSLVAEERDLQA